MDRSGGVHWHEHHVTRKERWALKGHCGAVVWLTGLSGSGKSTVANALDTTLNTRGKHTAMLDADNVRHGLNSNLGFSPEDRKENVRRLGEVAILLADVGTIVIVPVISPYRADRDLVRQRAAAAGVAFMEVHMATPLSTCETWDPKGLYAKARRGEIKGMTGIDAPYEEPTEPELMLGAGGGTPDELAMQIYAALEAAAWLSLPPDSAA